MPRTERSHDTLMVNRAPVLTLWGAVVAERLGFNGDEALSLGSAVAVLNAQSKGKRLGLFKPGEKGATKPAVPPGEEFFIEVVGRPVPVRDTDGGIRAYIKGKPVVPGKVQRYLEQKFGDALSDARAAMAAVAKSFKPAALAEAAYPLYEQVRPTIPPGTRGWGAKGELDLGWSVRWPGRSPPGGPPSRMPPERPIIGLRSPPSQSGSRREIPAKTLITSVVHLT